MGRTIKKTYTLTNKEIEILEEIKDRALSKKIVLNDSQIIRISLKMASEFSIDKIIEVSKNNLK